MLRIVSRASVALCSYLKLLVVLIILMSGASIICVLCFFCWDYCVRGSPTAQLACVRAHLLSCHRSLQAYCFWCMCDIVGCFGCMVVQCCLLGRWFVRWVSEI